MIVRDSIEVILIFSNTVAICIEKDSLWTIIIIITIWQTSASLLNTVTVKLSAEIFHS